jgi:hypothetical protein
MNAAKLSQDFRNASDDADDKLVDALGLWRALEAVLESRPELGTSDPRNTAVWATMRALREKLEQTDACFAKVWEVAKA